MAWVEHTGHEVWRVRYRQDGRVETVCGFASEEAARAYADSISTDRGSAGDGVVRQSVEEWVARWLTGLDVETRTEENYRAYLRNHILPRWGLVQLVDIRPLAITQWVRQLRARYAQATVATIVCVLSTVLDDAVDEGLIRLNPVRRRRRRGRRRDHQPLPHERVWATPEQALAVAAQACALAGRCAGLLVITAAWTGARWGELTGLRRDHVTSSTPEPAAQATSATRVGWSAGTSPSTRTPVRFMRERTVCGSAHRKHPHRYGPSPCHPSSPSCCTTT